MFQHIKKWSPFKRGDTSARRVASESIQNPLARIEQDFNQLFARMGTVLSPEGIKWPDLTTDSWFGDFSPMSFSPTLDLADKAKKLEVTLELPGMDADDVEIEVRDDSLVIHGEKKLEETTEEGGFYRTERSYGSFQRVVPLPTEVDADHIEASFKNGVLKVELPKTQPKEVATKRVPITAS